MKSIPIKPRRLRIKMLTLFLTLGFVFHLLGQKKEAKPNVVLFIADDLTYWDIGAYGGQAITPNIDQLVKEGMKFNNFYQAVPICAPTRMNLLTGMYPVKTGAYPQGSFVKEGIRSLPHYVRELGYKVALHGKRHIKPESAFPFEYLDSGKGTLEFSPVDEFLEKNSATPFVLMVASHETHYRWELGDTTQYKAHKLKLPKNWIDTPETRKYYQKYLAEATYLDAEVGKTVQLLKKHKLYENTLFIFTSEQGSSFPYSKWTCYEAGVHTAFVVRWPNTVAAGSESNALNDYTNVLPTLIDVLGGEVPEHLDGKSFKNVLLGKSDSVNDYTFSMQTTRGEPWGGDHFAIRAVRDTRYTYIWNIHPYMQMEHHMTRYGDGFFNSWREAGWKDKKANKLFLNYIRRPEFELYDRQTDPFEMNNLAGSKTLEKAELRLHSQLHKWMKYCGDKGHETEMEAYKHQWKKETRE